MKNFKVKSAKQENKIAKDIQGKVTIASGALYFQKADVRNSKFLVECKTTEKKSFPLTTKIWDKIEKESLRDNMRIPLLCIDVEDGTNDIDNSLVVFNWNDLVAYKEEGLFNNTKIDVEVLQLNKSVSVSKSHLEGIIDYAVNPLGVPIKSIFHQSKGKYLVMMYWKDFMRSGVL